MCWEVGLTLAGVELDGNAAGGDLRGLGGVGDVLEGHALGEGISGLELRHVGRFVCGGSVGMEVWVRCCDEVDQAARIWELLGLLNSEAARTPRWRGQSQSLRVLWPSVEVERTEGGQALTVA